MVLLDDDALIKILSNPFVLDIFDFTLYFLNPREKRSKKSGMCAVHTIHRIATTS